MTNVLLVVHLILCLGLIILVLIQRSEGGALSGLGGGGQGGGMSGLMTGRSASNLLTRATGLMAGGFMITSLVLSLIANADRNNGSILDDETTPASVVEQPAVPKTAEPGAPLAK